MMKIAITGEGSTDYGKKDYATGKWLQGPAIVYAENIAKEQGKEVELLPIEREDVQRVRLQGRSTKGLQGKGITAKKFMVLMNKSGCDAGIYYCDIDKESGMKSSNQSAVDKHYEKMYEDVSAGLDTNKAIPMMPLSMIECWMLADKTALEQVYGVRIKEGQIPAKPEYIWGAKSEPNSDYPKNYLLRLIQSLDKKYDTYQVTRSDLNEIASYSKLLTLRKRCPLSFERFYTDFVELLDEY